MLAIAFIFSRLASPASAAGVSVWVSDGDLLRNPRGIVFDSVGNAFVAVQGTDAVTKVTAAGVVSEYATGLQNPWGVALDGAGNLYVTLVNKKELWEIAPDGSRTLVASGLKNMHHLAFNPADGLLYVTREDGVSTVNPNTGLVSAIWETPYPNGTDNCWGIALDGAGGFYVAMKLSRDEWLFHVTPGGQGGWNTATVETDGNKIPRSLAVDALGHLYAGDNKKQLWLYPGGQGPGQLLSENELKQPFGLAVHPLNGDLYVTESTMERIAIWDLSFDGSGPVVNVTAPAGGALTSDNTPAIAVSYADADSGVKTGTLNVQVDGVDVTAGLTIAAGSATGELAAPLADGPHTLTAQIENLYGIPTVATSVFTVDGAAPTLSVTSPAEGQTLGVNTVSVTGQTGDMGGSGVASVNVNGQGLTLAGNDFTGQVSLNEGANVLTFTATDAAGNSAQAIRTVTYAPPDVTPPVVALVSPTVGQTFNTNTVSIVATATDDRGVNAGSVTLTLDGAAVTATVNLPNVTATASNLGDGPHTLTLTAQDSAGNAAAPVTVTFTTDNTAPTLNVTQPATDETLSVNTATLAGAVSDAVGPVTVTLNGVSIPLSMDPNQQPPGLKPEVSSLLFNQALTLAEGLNTFTLIATDSAGHSTTVVRTITYTPPPPPQEEEEEPPPSVEENPPPAPDTTPPVITLQSHPMDAVVSEASVALAGVAADDVALGSLTLNGQNVPLSSGNFSHALTLNEGVNVLTLVLADAAGNTASLVRTLTYTPPTPPAETPVPVVENPPAAEPPVVQPPPTETPVPVVENPPPVDPPVVTPPPAETPVPVAENPPAAEPPVIPPVADTTPPMITLQSPALTTLSTTEATVNLSGVVTDDSGGVSLTVNGVTLVSSLNPNQQPLGPKPEASSPQFSSLPFNHVLTLAPGPNVFVLVASDASGNITTTPLNLTRETPVDNTPPLLTITQPPKDPFWLNTLSYVLEGNTTPGASVKVDDADAVVTPDGKFVMPVTLTEGNNTLLIAATKGGGSGGLRKRGTSNTGGATGETTTLVELVVDTLAPEITWLNPDASGNLDAQSPVRVNVQEPVGATGSGVNPQSLALTVDGQTVTLTANGPSGDYTAQLPSLSTDAVHTFVLTAADNAGNPAVSTVVVSPQAGDSGSGEPLVMMSEPEPQGSQSPAQSQSVNSPSAPPPAPALPTGGLYLTEALGTGFQISRYAGNQSPLEWVTQGDRSHILPAVGLTGQVIFSSTKGQNSEVFLRAGEIEASVLFSTPVGQYAGYSTVSPAGNQIIVAIADGQGIERLYNYDFQGGLRLLTPPEESANLPSLGPNGLLAYMQKTGTGFDIALATLSLSGSLQPLRQVSLPGASIHTYPTLSVNGQWLYFLANGEGHLAMYRLDLFEADAVPQRVTVVSGGTFSEGELSYVRLERQEDQVFLVADNPQGQRCYFVVNQLEGGIVPEPVYNPIWFLPQATEDPETTSSFP